MERWFIEESGDAELGFTWSVFKLDGARLVCYAQCFDESYAEQIVSALKWQDTLGSARMSLAQDGITFNANTGEIWTPPKARRGPALKIESSKRKTK